MTANDRVIYRAGKAVFWSALVLLALVCLAAFASGPNDLHVEPETAGVYAAVAGVTWSVLLFLSLGLMFLRWYRYRHDGERTPRLLYRDIISKLGLATPILLLYGSRIYTASQQAIQTNTLATWIPWLVWTTVPPIVGMATFLFFEIFVIDAIQDPA